MSPAKRAMMMRSQNFKQINAELEEVRSNHNSLLAIVQDFKNNVSFHSHNKVR